jgi:hypothetical protein
VQITRGVEFTFPDGLSLAAGEYVVVVNNRDAFATRYGTEPIVAGQFENGELSNSGELLELRDRAGHVIQSFTYDDQDGWPRRPDGKGSSLEIVDPLAGHGDLANWRASSEWGGSPGRAPAGLDGRIAITEILAHSVPPGGDLVELHNPTDQPIDITNWYVGNSTDNYFPARITAPTTVPAGGYHVLSLAGLGIDLNWWRGDEVWLTEADASGRPLRLVDHVQFGPSGLNVSVGPAPDVGGDWRPLARQTFGRQNSGSLTGDVIVSEVHYAPIDPDGDRRQFKAEQFEFVELYNRTDAAIDLSGWRLTGDTEITFPSGTAIGPHQTLLAAAFDAADSLQTSIFRVNLGLGSDTPLVGPFDGGLNDGGGLVRLERIELPPADEPDFVPYLYVDEVAYGDSGLWPGEIAGTGHSLQRRSPTAPGNVPSSWMAARANPGSVDFALRQPGDANEDGQFDQRDIVLVLRSGKFRSGEPADWSEGDWNEDGQFDQRDLVEALQTGEYQRGASARRADAFFETLDEAEGSRSIQQTFSILA